MALYPSCISSTFIFILIDRKGTQFASRIIVAHSSHSPFDWPCKAMKLRNGFQAMLTTAYILTIPSSQTLCETLFTCAIFDDISMTDKLVCDAKKDNQRTFPRCAYRVPKRSTQVHLWKPASVIHDSQEGCRHTDTFKERRKAEHSLCKYQRKKLPIML